MAERFLFATGIDLNANFDVQPDFFGGTKINVRINIKSRASLTRLVRWADYGHAVYALFGTECTGAGYTYSEAGLDFFLKDYGRDIVALTNRNEWDVFPDIEGTRAENAWAHRVCKERGVPFAISSTLVQDWHGNITGLGGPGQWPGLANLYRPGEVDGELVDLHLYSYGDGVNLAQMLAQYRAMGYQEPTIVGEFGTRIGDDIPVREMFSRVLNSVHRVGSAMLFCLQDFDDPNKRFGLLRTDGSRKDAFDEFVQVARERQDQKYIIRPGDVIVPPPIDNPYPVELGFADYQQEHFEQVGLAIGRQCYLVGHDGHGGENEINGQPFDKGWLWWVKDSNEVRFSPFSAAS